MAGGANTVGGGTHLPLDLPVSTPFCGPFCVALENPLGGALTKVRPIRGREVFAFGFTFVSTLAFVKGYLIRSMCGTFRNGRGTPDGSAGVSELGHISRMAA